MFASMNHVKTEHYSARNTEYELRVYLVHETKEHRIYISTSGDSVGDMFTASDDVIKDAKLFSNVDIVEKLITIAKQDIEKNEFGQY
jgi:hypothetical protein